MSQAITIPSLGESVTEATLIRWIVPDGGEVKVDQPVCELETDKANVEIPSPAKGFIKHAVSQGTVVKIGQKIADVQAESSGKPAAASKVAPPPAAKEASKEAPKEVTGAEGLSPSARRAVRETGVDPAKIEGTGPRGRITKEDVFGAAQGKPSTTPSAAFSAQAVQTPAGPGVRRVPMTKIRKKIAERLVQAQHNAAMLTTFNEIDMSAVLSLREKYKEKFTQMHGVPLGLMSFFSRAVVLALKEFTALNAFIEGDDLVYHDYTNLGIAVSTERGLVVPVLHNVENMSFAKIETEIKRMALAAREGKLSLNELGGGTFTITNGGVFGSLLSTPILNTPQSGILGLHAIQKRPIAVEDKIEIRPMMYTALSYDHRVVDGKESVSFLVRMKTLLEDPTRLMLEV